MEAGTQAIASGVLPLTPAGLVVARDGRGRTVGSSSSFVPSEGICIAPGAHAV